MPDKRAKKVVAGPASLKDFAGVLLLWAAGGLTLLAIIWFVTLSRIAGERVAEEKILQELAVSYSSAYAEQVQRTIAQIEQLTISLQYQWTMNRAGVSLEEQYQYGLYPRAAKIYITIVDVNGKGVTSTLAGPVFDAADQEYFRFHRTFADSRLRLDGKLVEGDQSGLTLLRFTRRLEAADGSFNGVVVVGVEPEYLATFNDENSLGPRDFISIRHKNGTLLVSEKGKDIRNQGQVHREPPKFETDNGTMLAPGSRFKDGETRIMAWEKHRNYPIISYAGLCERCHLAKHFETARTYRNMTVAATVAILLTMFAGMAVSVRHGRRRQQIAEVRKVFRIATDAAREGFFMVRPVYGANDRIEDFIFEECNEYGAQLFNREKSQIIGHGLNDVLPPAYREEVLGVYRRAMENGFYEDEVRVPSISPIEATWIYRRLVRSGDGLAVTIRDISEAKAHERTLLDMANTDALTGLPNRHWLMNYLPGALESAGRSGALVAVLFVDLDDFKDINDTLGHSAGDEVLQAVASRLKSLLRPNDHVIRLGGDEFTIVLTSVVSHEEVSQVAARITQSFRQPLQTTARIGLIGASVGISLFPHDGAEAEVLLQNSDVAMYFAKEEAKGGFRFYNQQLHDRIKNRLDAEQELADAVIGDQFVIHYQPRVHTMTGTLTGLEALVRWNHPVRGLVMPNDFIPLAEEAGTIVTLGALIMEKVCAQIAAWRAAGEPVVPVSVNISARQFNAGGVHLNIAALLKSYELPSSVLEVELTESAMMSESQDIIQQIGAINAMGIKIHVDDFGTGYSSLSRLQEFNMHVLKIDRAFTGRLGQGKEAEVLFRSIVSMAKGLGMSVVAEGVETAEQLQLLRELACDEVQGYFFSRPVPASEIVHFMRRGILTEEAAPH